MNDPVNEWERRLAGSPPIKNGFTSDLERKVRERIRMKQKDRNAPFRTVAALLSVIMLLGCGWWFREDLKQLIQKKGPNDSLAALMNDSLADEGEITLKIQDFQYSNFMLDIGRPFIMRHPSVDFTLSLTPDPAKEKLSDWIDREKPDVLRLSPSQFRELALQGKLKPLDALAKKDGFKLDSLYKPVVDTVRQLGGGELYGFAPSFSTQAVYVNKKLFEKYHIELPKDGITVDELLQTAMRFNGTGVAGLSTSTGMNGYHLISLLGNMSGLRTISPDGKQLTLNTPAWNGLWDRVTDGLKAGWIKDNVINWAEHPGGLSTDQIEKLDVFAQGKAAMTISGFYYTRDLAQYQLPELDNNWMTVSLSPADSSSGFYLDSIYAVNAKTTHEKAAWELVKFLAGQDYAKKMIDNGSLPVYTKLTQLSSLPDEQWKSFYSPDLDPEQIIAAINRSADEKIAKEEREVSRLGNETLNSVLNGELPADKALVAIEYKLLQSNPSLRGSTTQ
jgi:multiple sugar transport system substrate-binding protein